MTIYDVLSTMKSNPRSHDPPQGLGVQGSRSFAIIREKGVCMHVFVCVCVCVYWKSQGTEPICCLEKETVCK